jgi:RHS repeat-associated protein
MYDEAGHLVGEYDSSGNLIQETVWLGDIPVATLRPNGASVDVYYVHSDQLNTPRKVSRPSDNQLRWRWDPTPFGEGAPDEDPASLGAFVYNLRFPGQQFDVESNLSYNYFRDYDPAIGRYIESDPIGLEGGLNTFAYAFLNPASISDPTGLVPGPWHPPTGTKLACRYADTCSQILGKMETIMRMINSHQGWDRTMPRPRGGNRHAPEIADLWRAYAKCQQIYSDKQCDCEPKGSYQTSPATQDSSATAAAALIIIIIIIFGNPAAA